MVHSFELVYYNKGVTISLKKDLRLYTTKNAETLQYLHLFYLLFEVSRIDLDQI